MLEIIKDKLFPVQQDLSERSLDEGQHLDLTAGAALLESYKVKWEALHRASEDIVKEADRVEQLTKQTATYLDDQCKVMAQLGCHFSSLPQVLQDLNTVTKTLESVGSGFDSLEKSLADLENVIEIQELQRKQRIERYNLVLHKEKRNMDHKNLGSVLASKYTIKVEEMDKRQRSVLTERHVAFGEAFKEDLKHYVQFGRVERVVGIRDSDTDLRLEDVSIEQDNDELGAFLDDKCEEI